MNVFVPAKTAEGAETVRLGDDDLHRGARKGLHQGGHVVFGVLPRIIDRVIEHKVWKTRTKKFKNFGEYVLDQTSEGLGIENNQLLWLLRCSLDVHGRHIKEWAEVLEEVEKAVRVWAKEEGKKIRGFNGNSLEQLSKACVQVSTDKKITYLPSRAGQKNIDSRLVRLGRSDPESYRKVLSGKMKMTPGEVYDPVDRAIMYIRRMKKADVKRLIARMTAEGWI
jgi:hypothetical protein